MGNRLINRLIDKIFFEIWLKNLSRLLWNNSGGTSKNTYLSYLSIIINELTDIVPGCHFCMILGDIPSSRVEVVIFEKLFKEFLTFIGDSDFLQIYPTINSSIYESIYFEMTKVMKNFFN